MKAYAVVNYTEHKIVGVYTDINRAREVRDKQRRITKELSEKYGTPVETFYIDTVNLDN